MTAAMAEKPDNLWAVGFLKLLHGFFGTDAGDMGTGLGDGDVGVALTDHQRFAVHGGKPQGAVLVKLAPLDGNGFAAAGIPAFAALKHLDPVIGLVIVELALQDQHVPEGLRFTGELVVHLLMSGGEFGT